MNKVLDNTWRDVSAPVLDTSRSDSTLSKDWYRLKLNGTDAILPSEASGLLRCGTSVSVWYNGKSTIKH